jgi:trk system potassium uptake protein TrkA
MFGNRNGSNQVVVIGLGRFGASVGAELVRRDCEVLGIDSRPKVVQLHADDLTHSAVADTTDTEALRQLGVPDFTRAVVGIGTSIEASVLTTQVLSDFNIPHIWAKATSRQHGRILERVGAHHVVLPEYDMGERVAHLVTGRMLDYVQVEDDFAIAKTHAPSEAVGRPLGECKLRKRYGVTVVGIKQPGQKFTYTTTDTVVGADLLIVSGTKSDIERFTDLSQS